MICPKCKSENEDTAVICEQCGFKLKLKCPHCGALNLVGTKVCPSCNTQLLKKCTSCGAVNFAQATKCRKCSVLFENIQKQEEQPKAAGKYATIAIELINISSLKSNIKSVEMVQKVISKFYQLFAKTVKKYDLKPLKLNENTLVVEVSNTISFVESINKAIEIIENIDNQIDEISELLENKLNVSYKVRYFVGVYKPTQKQEILSSISLGVVDDIIFDEQIHSYLKEKMLFKEIENNKGEKFYKFLDQDNPEMIVSELPKEDNNKSRMELVSEFINKVQSVQEGFVACINAPTGVGKSNIFNMLKMTFEEDNSNIWLLGHCSLQSKNNSIAFFKDMLQNLFDIPAFNIDIDNTKHRVYSALVEKIGIDDKDVIDNIFAILFYDDSRLQNAVYINKQNTYNAIAAVFRALLAKGAVVLQIEDIENIDNFSLEILRSLFEDGILKCNLKIFVSSNMDIDIAQFFASAHLNKDNSLHMQYPTLSKEEMDDFILKAIGVRDDLGSKVLNHIYEYAKGLPVFVEEFLYLLLQLGLVKFTNNAKAPISIAPELESFNLPKTINEIVQMRLTNISNISFNAFKVLYYASILGYKFLPAVVQNILKINDEDFEEILKYLAMNNFIVAFDSYNYTFKNRTLWEAIRYLDLNDENKINNIKIAMDTLVQVSMPSMSTVVFNLLDAKMSKYEILNYIEQATKEAYSVGDDYAYVYFKTMLLEGVELSAIENKNEIAIAIKEELLNLTYMTFPDTAIKLADELLAHYEAIDTAKTIDILGLMSMSFEITGNYLAAIECVDKALEKIDAKSNLLAGMLLYYSKLNSLLQLGRYEELTNTAQNVILPVIEQYNKNKIDEYTTLYPDDLNSIEFETRYLSALALALQGSPKCQEQIQQLYAAANEMANTEYTLKAQLTNGVFKLLQGDSAELENILSSTQQVIPDSKDKTQNTLIWLILKNINRFFKGEFATISNELMMLSNFCKNAKRFALEPVVKGLLAQTALQEGNIEVAQNLSYELFYKCSNNQWALGALLNWYMYCENSLYKENYDEALKVAQNALDVAEKANINNLFFSALFKMKIAQIYSLRNDCDMAKINAAEAQQLAEINGYLYIIAFLGIVYYDILLKQITQNPSLKNDNVKEIYKYLLNSREAIEKLKNNELALQVNQKIENIEKFAQDNGISLE